MNTTKQTILVTGAAGFIGHTVALRLAGEGHTVVGLDNLNDYYDVNLKRARLKRLEAFPNFRFVLADVADLAALTRIFEAQRIDRVVHLAAQAGVRYSLQNPHAYVQANLVGFVNMLECCRHHKAEHLVYASSSSVYGGNEKTPFSIHDNVDHPVSLYAATKKSNELLAHSYSHLFRLPTTGLRFFTVYGPWGRPDMAAFLFTKAILAGEPIQLFNEGRMKRDFTYIDDIVEGIVRTLFHTAAPLPGWSGAHPDPAGSNAPYRVYNIGNNTPVELLYFVEVIEKELGRKALRKLLPMQPGDVPATCADVDDLTRDVGFKPKTSIEDGLRAFVQWYRSYFGA